MVEWESPETVEICLFVFGRLTILCLGTYLWYFVLSFDKVELGLLTCRIRFQFAHVPYLLGRYAHIVTLLTIVSTTPRTVPMDPAPCGGLGPMQLIASTGDLAITCASYNLALRAIVLWNDHKRTSFALRAMCAVHLVFGMILGPAGVTEQWDPSHTFCNIGIADRARVGLLFFLIFTITLDMTILAMTVLGIRRKGLPPDSPLTVALFRQGFGYGIITLLTCIPMGVLSFLPLNSVMNVMLLPPGCTISVIASSATVTSLWDVTKSEHLKEAAERHKMVRSPDLTTKYPLSTVIDFTDFDDPSEDITTEERVSSA